MFLSKKKYVIIQGGLGNQMSQFAFYLSIREHFGDNVYPLNMCRSKKFNGLELNRVFKAIKTDFISSKALYILTRIMATSRFPFLTSGFQYLLTLLGVTCINEKYNYSFKPEIFELTNSNFFLFLGGWHCEKYFVKIEQSIRMLYKFNLDNLDSKNIFLLNNIKKSESVAIHIRRGDYYTVGSKILGGICNHNYYRKAISSINKRVKNPKYFIFSDDPDWVKKHYMLDGVYVEGNTGENSWKDMLLMSVCKHNIICNSSFSWWGAWLNKNKNKIVICPSKFIIFEKTTDVYPETWSKINV
jgi:hypothetical protein